MNCLAILVAAIVAFVIGAIHCGTPKQTLDGGCTA